MSDRIGPYKPYDGPYPGDRMRTADGRTGVVRALGLNGQILLQTDDGEVLPWLPGGELESAP